MLGKRINSPHVVELAWPLLGCVFCAIGFFRSMEF